MAFNRSAVGGNKLVGMGPIRCRLSADDQRDIKSLLLLICCKMLSGFSEIALT